MAQLVPTENSKLTPKFYNKLTKDSIILKQIYKNKQTKITKRRQKTPRRYPKPKPTRNYQKTSKPTVISFQINIKPKSHICKKNRAQIWNYQIGLIDRYILFLIICLCGLIFLRICVIKLTNWSEDNPVFFVLNFCKSSVVVIGLRIRYRRTASSVTPLSLKFFK